MGKDAVAVPDIRQHPTIGLFTFNEVEHSKRTKRIDYEVDSVDLGTVVGLRREFKIPNRGIVSEIRLHLAIDVTGSNYADGDVTLLDRWVDGIVSNVRIRANNTDLVQTDGAFLEDMRIIDSQNADYSAVEVKKEVLATDKNAFDTATVSLYLVVCVPLATNRQTIGGSVFAESNDTYLNCQVEFESADELYTLINGATLTMAGTLYAHVTAWTIPYVQTSKGMLAILPDLRYHAMILTRRLFKTGSGEQRIPFSTAHGSMARVLWRVRDDSAKAYVDPLTTSRVKFRYGQNQGLRDMRVRDLLLQNARWFKRTLKRNGLALDFVAENSLRDTVVPDEVLDMEIVHDLGTTSMAAGDYIDVCEQAVIENETWARAVPVTAA